MLVRDSEWQISYLLGIALTTSLCQLSLKHFTHMAEITCPYGTMPLNHSSHIQTGIFGAPSSVAY